MRRTLSLGLFLIAVLSQSKSAFAQDANQSRAQILFERGRTLLQDGKVGEACEQLHQSYELEPLVGTLLNLALCHEMQGRNVSAWREYTVVLERSERDGNQARVALAEKQISSILPKLSRANLVFHPSSTTLEVSLDGSLLPSSELTRPIPLDPGIHVFEVRGKEKKAFSVRIEATVKGGLLTVNVPELENLAAPLPAAYPSATVAPPLPPPPPADSHSPTVAYVLFGVSLTSFAAAGYMALRTKNSWDDRNNHCPASRCDAQAVEYYNDAKSYAIYADIGVGIGLAASAVGVYWLLTDSPAPKTSIRVTPSFSAQSAGLGLHARF